MITTKLNKAELIVLIKGMTPPPEIRYIKVIANNGSGYNDEWQWRENAFRDDTEDDVYRVYKLLRIKVFGDYNERDTSDIELGRYLSTLSDSDNISIINYINCLRDNDFGKLSDGYHTYDELYHHRAILFATLCNILSERAWKSKMHSDGTMYDGMFIVGIDTDYGQATYHYNIDTYWDLFNVKTLDIAPTFDGHTPEVALERIYTLSPNLGVAGATLIYEKAKELSDRMKIPYSDAKRLILEELEKFNY